MVAEALLKNRKNLWLYLQELAVVVPLDQQLSTVTASGEYHDTEKSIIL